MLEVAGTVYTEGGDGEELDLLSYTAGGTLEVDLLLGGVPEEYGGGGADEVDGLGELEVYTGGGTEGVDRLGVYTGGGTEEVDRLEVYTGGGTEDVELLLGGVCE